jgi:ketosteroid isomerase-like protein
MPSDHRRRRCPGGRTTRFAAPLVLGAVWLGLVGAQQACGQPTQPVTEPDPTKAIALLRGELIDAFNKGDLDRLLSHLDPDVVVTWQNAEVCRGPQAVRAFYERMMVGPDRVVQRISTNPTVDDRHVYDGAWAVSWGNMHDEFELNDGSRFRFDSRFTATIARRGEAWKVTAFHASVNAFENPILGIAARKAGTWAGVGGLAVGAALGAVGATLVARRRSRRAGGSAGAAATD